jgi:vacuolar-type H+-ATPase subunit I/STV1
MRTFIQTLALLIGLFSSLFLVKGTLALSTMDLAELSKPKWDYNLDVAKNLCRQRADIVVGFSLLLLSYFLQLINLLFPMRWQDFLVSKTGLVIAIIVAILIFFGFYYISNGLYKTYYQQVENILLKSVKN